MADKKIKNKPEEKADSLGKKGEDKTSEKATPDTNENEETQPLDENEPENESISEEEEAESKEQEKIEKLETKLSELSDKHLRLQAEFDNFRRRTLKEKAELIKSGGQSTIVTLLPIIDDFERALDSLKNVPDDDAGKLGTTLIYTKFKDFLKQNNVTEIDAFHQDFDVDLHEAVTKIPASEKKLKGKVVDVIQKGYMLNDKVIRFAKVIVGE